MYSHILATMNQRGEKRKCHFLKEIPDGYLKDECAKMHYTLWIINTIWETLSWVRKHKSFILIVYQAFNLTECNGSHFCGIMDRSDSSPYFKITFHNSDPIVIPLSESRSPDYSMCQKLIFQMKREKQNKCRRVLKCLGTAVLT